MEIDAESVSRMIEHHVRLGIKGLFACGTNGEGPWMTDAQRRALLRAVVRCTRKRMPVAVQVTDNSAARILDNMAMAKSEGADIAVIAPPYFIANASPENILKIYMEAIRRSPLPVGIYDRGKFGAVFVPDEILSKIYAEPKVIIIKDSSTMPERMQIALEARRRRPSLCLLDGDEFHCVQYISAGYDGLLLGGGVFNGYIAGQIIEAAKSGDMKKAEQLQARMNNIMWAVYGGKKITCWLAGEKELLVRMGIFKTRLNYPNYPLNPACRRAIERVLKQNRKLLLP
jgi:4-hydroxy-tetrahydrodipicolinate synthase